MRDVFIRTAPSTSFTIFSTSTLRELWRPGRHGAFISARCGFHSADACSRSCGDSRTARNVPLQLPGTSPCSCGTSTLQPGRACPPSSAIDGVLHACNSHEGGVRRNGSRFSFLPFLPSTLPSPALPGSLGKARLRAPGSPMCPGNVVHSTLSCVGAWELMRAREWMRERRCDCSFFICKKQ